MAFKQRNASANLSHEMSLLSNSAIFVRFKAGSLFETLSLVQRHTQRCYEGASNGMSTWHLGEQKFAVCESQKSSRNKHRNSNAGHDSWLYPRLMEQLRCINMVQVTFISDLRFKCGQLTGGKAQSQRLRCNHAAGNCIPQRQLAGTVTETSTVAGCTSWMAHLGDAKKTCRYTARQHICSALLDS